MEHWFQLMNYSHCCFVHFNFLNTLNTSGLRKSGCEPYNSRIRLVRQNKRPSSFHTAIVKNKFTTFNYVLANFLPLPTICYQLSFWQVNQIYHLIHQYVCISYVQIFHQVSTNTNTFLNNFFKIRIFVTRVRRTLFDC